MHVLCHESLLRRFFERDSNLRRTVELAKPDRARAYALDLGGADRSLDPISSQKISPYASGVIALVSSADRIRDVVLLGRSVHQQDAAHWRPGVCSRRRFGRR